MLTSAKAGNGQAAPSLRFSKKIRTDELAWLSALSPDEKHVAYIGFQTGKLFVVEVESERTVEIQIPDLRDKRLLVWSRDSQRLAVANGATLVLASLLEGRVIQQYPHLQGGAFGRAASFSEDGKRLLFQNSNAQSKDVLLELDLASGEYKAKLSVPGAATAQALFVNEGLIQGLAGSQLFSTQVGFWRGKMELR
ncbi:MAG: hypothetical protein P4M07_24420 [Xanthobacteraceae bacterium]|nr:hypothetical protein [Xanthobacteraceae bacterium]